MQQTPNSFTPSIWSEMRTPLLNLDPPMIINHPPISLTLLMNSSVRPTRRKKSKNTSSNPAGSLYTKTSNFTRRHRTRHWATSCVPWLLIRNSCVLTVIRLETATMSATCIMTRNCLKSASSVNTTVGSNWTLMGRWSIFNKDLTLVFTLSPRLRTIISARFVRRSLFPRPHWTSTCMSIRSTDSCSSISRMTSYGMTVCWRGVLIMFIPTMLSTSR